MLPVPSVLRLTDALNLMLLLGITKVKYVLLENLEFITFPPLSPTASAPYVVLVTDNSLLAYHPDNPHPLHRHRRHNQRTAPNPWPQRERPVHRFWKCM